METKKLHRKRYYRKTGKYLSKYLLLISHGQPYSRNIVLVELEVAEKKFLVFESGIQYLVSLI